jgi:SWIB/MDM2 domain
MRFHYPILAVAALRGRDGRLRAGSGIVAGVTVGLYDALKVVFGGKKQVSMFEMTKLVSGHIK